MVPVVSKTWSCSTLMAATGQVQQHYEHLKGATLSEEAMRTELAEPQLKLVVVKKHER